MTENDPFLRPASAAQWEPAAPQQPTAETGPSSTAQYAPAQGAPDLSAYQPQGSATPPLNYGAPQAQPASDPFGQASAAPASDQFAGRQGFAPQAPPAYPAPASYSSSSGSDTDGVSIAALITGILGLAIVPLILGAVGLRRTAQGARKGTWMAVSGLVLGVIATVVYTWLLAFALAATLDYAEATGVSFDVEAGYGDDAYLDGLYEQCAAGDDAACDTLFTDSPIGSDYESFGEECGGRGLPAGQLWCDPNSGF
ncbi:hypothetical protein ON058_04375 [Demequina sp. B12]|uniref:DUF4190 domain-containing protein n=1 Tax=Demequina sp. B12 TaxID=2992757 RepID=UPI00237B9862|nr:hypothetical protein [Demequina sp. B12]MDE0572648.1 hypothetical protein [Demequina sp. B12]